MDESRHDSKIFSAFISEEIQKLRKWYEDNQDLKDLLTLREQKFLDIRDNFTKNVLPTMKTKNYQYFSDVSINNARLLLYDLYVGDQKDFEQLALAKGRDFKVIFKLLKSLEGKEDPVSELSKMSGQKGL